ncbi:hypothetical protein GRI58_03950 [Porphyrobacter algicida]|uniref:Uncharacterized protein n=1 Tax=Qipengyuania algicida TaxID=1836209 RepID=A0A845AE72_9SPHN|nr:hypothetical protein [Qipengyuania algicida]MXP27974.1 hypothetical protein [Qipengyuania algicida]
MIGTTFINISSSIVRACMFGKVSPSVSVTEIVNGLNPMSLIISSEALRRFDADRWV